jgi:hypothetical protein
MTAPLSSRTNRFSDILRLFVPALPLLACCGLWIILNWALADYDMFNSDDVSPQTIEANADIKLPPSAHDIHGYYSGFREFFILTRFAIAAEDLDRFLGSTGCTDPLAPTDPHLHTVEAGNPAWWRPMDARRLAECRGLGEHVHQHIMVDMSDAATYIVYVAASTL